jgi:hypothetical protein
LQAGITAIEALIREGHADLNGLCLALSDWWMELRLIERDMALESKKCPPRQKPGGQKGR